MILSAVSFSYCLPGVSSHYFLSSTPCISCHILIVADPEEILEL